MDSVRKDILETYEEFRARKLSPEVASRLTLAHEVAIWGEEIFGRLTRIEEAAREKQAISSLPDRGN